MWLINPHRFGLPFNQFSMDFDGVNEGIDCGNDASLDFEFSNTFSLSIWAKFNNVSSIQHLISKQQDTGDVTGYAILLLANGTIRWNRQNDNGPDVSARIVTNAAISANAWHHIVCTTDGTASATGMTIYIDGVSVATTTEFNNLGTNTISNTETFKIGVRGTSSFPLNGKADEVTVYNSEISSGDVTTLYGGGTPTEPSTTNLVSYWKKGEGATFSTNWTIPDEQGSNTGTSVNMEIGDRSTDTPP